MTKSPIAVEQALMNCEKELADPSQNWEGFCLKFCRTMYGIPALYGNAVTAYAKARTKNPYQQTNTAGVFHFWDDGNDGHVTINAKEPFGFVYTSGFDSGAGKISKISREVMMREKTFNFLGSSVDINGYEIDFDVIKGYIPDPIEDVWDGANKIGSFLTNGHNWVRIGMALLAVLMLTGGIILWRG